MSLCCSVLINNYVNGHRYVSTITFLVSVTFCFLSLNVLATGQSKQVNRPILAPTCLFGFNKQFLNQTEYQRETI